MTNYQPPAQNPSNKPRDLPTDLPANLPADFPADLAALSQMLDALAKVDIASADAGLEDRLCDASIAELIMPAQVQSVLNEDALRVRSSALPGFEQRVFDQSVNALAGSASPTIASTREHSAVMRTSRGVESGVPVGRRRAWWASRGVRAAAAIGLVGLSALGLRLAMTAPSSSATLVANQLAPLSTAELSKSLNDDFALLLAAADELNPNSAQAFNSRSSGVDSSGDMDFSQSWLDEIELPSTSSGGDAS